MLFSFDVSLVKKGIQNGTLLKRKQKENKSNNARYQNISFLLILMLTSKFYHSLLIL